MKSRSSLLAPADPGGPGKRAVKWLWCGGGGMLQSEALRMPRVLKMVYLHYSQLKIMLDHCFTCIFSVVSAYD